MAAVKIHQNFEIYLVKFYTKHTNVVPCESTAKGFYLNSHEVGFPSQTQ